jgi:peptidoglycan-N-acetylglucosamine deacetylase
VALTTPLSFPPDYPAAVAPTAPLGRPARAGYLGAPVPPTIHLTYDDGPDPEWTPRVLEALARHDARATFFVDARRALLHRDLVGEAERAGHEIAFHCFEHVRHSERGEAEMEADLGLGLRLLDRIDVRPRAWRAPWGIETDATRRLATERGLRLWGWTFDTHDWRGDSAEEMWAALEARGGLRGGDVVLMHDALGPGARRDGCEETVRLTELLLARAAEASFAAATLSASTRAAGSEIATVPVGGGAAGLETEAAGVEPTRLETATVSAGHGAAGPDAATLSPGIGAMA